MSHDNSLLSKVGSATIAALGRAVNTLLTPTTMGAEKFNIFVTIDNEKALEIGHFLKVSRQKRVSRRCQSGICVRDRHVDNIDLIFRYGGETITFQEPIEVENSATWIIPCEILAAIFLSRSAIKDATNVGFIPPAYVSDAPRVVDCGFDSFEGSDPGCGYV